jgi:DNA-binding transcriptional regulator LsrR (DeoR family)
MSYVRQGSYLPGTTTNITTSGSSQATGAVGNTTAIVRVAVTENTYVAVGTGNTTATTSNMLIPAGGVEFLAVTPATGNVAVLQVTTAGIASITQLAELP